MSIVRTDVIMTPSLCNATIQRLVDAYPACRSEVLIYTVFQRPVRTLVIGSGPRKVLYTAAHHANEWITALLLLRFAEELARAIQEDGKIFGVPAKTIDKYTTVHIVPMVDPDGVDLVVGAIPEDSEAYRLAREISQRYPGVPFPDGWKANLLGVDLNLQYPAGWLQAREIKFSQGYVSPAPRDFVGAAPLDQQETAALAVYTEEVDPDLVLAFHSQGKEIYWQFEDVFVPGAKELGEEFARLSGYTLADTPYESAYAGYKDWFIKYYRKPGYTIEVGLGENPLPLSQFEEIYRDNLGILVTAATGSEPSAA